MYPYASDQIPEMYTSAYLPENTTQMMLTSDESTSLASDGSKDDVMRDTSRFTAVVLGVIIALGVLVLAMTVIMLSSGSKFHEKTFGTETQPGITENWRYTAIGATGTTPQPWFKSTVTSLTSQLTTTTTKESYGHLTKEPFTSTEKSIITVSLSTARTPEQGRLVSLLCTMGDKLGAPHMLPEDGPCDYLFYDSLFKKGFVLNGTLDSSMGLFINHHWWVKKAVTGTGLAYKYTKELFNWLDEDSTALPYLLNIFLKFRIRNYGCLDTASNGYDGLVMKQMLLILKSIDSYFTREQPHDEKCVTVFALPPADPKIEDAYAEHFLYSYTPSIVVIISHYLEGDNTFEDCRVVQPAMLKRPPLLTTNSSYTYDMSTAAETMRKLVERGVNSQWALSVTMKGRWNTLKAGQPAAFLSECVHDPAAESFGSYTEVCQDPSFINGSRYKTGAYGPLYYNRSDGRTFTFDNETTHVDKLCKVRTQQGSYAFGVAAYDVDYDDFSNACSSTNYFGKFSRLFCLKGLLKYTKDGFREPGKLADCLKECQ